MKSLKQPLTFLCLLYFGVVFSQQTTANLYNAPWSQATTWIGGNTPTKDDDVILMHDIVVDVNASCHSLTTNGHNVHVNNGYTLTITGTGSGVSNINDTILEKVVVTYAGDFGGGTSFNIDYISFEYDSLHRVTKKTQYGENAASVKTWFYQGNNMLPFKTIFNNPCEYQVSDTCVARQDTTYFLYNNAGIVVYDSTVSSRSQNHLPYKEVNNYQLTANTVTRTKTFTTFVISPSGSNGFNIVTLLQHDTTLFTLQTNNGNIVQQNGSGSAYTSTHTVNYDTQKNPFYAVRSRIPLIVNDHDFFDPFQQNNNPRTYQDAVTIEGTTESDDNIYGYRYNTTGLPVELVIIDQANSFVYRFSFVYRK